MCGGKGSKGNLGIIHDSKDQHDQAGTAFNSFSVFVLPAGMWLVEEHTSREGYTSGMFFYLVLRILVSGGEDQTD